MKPSLYYDLIHSSQVSPTHTFTACKSPVACGSLCKLWHTTCGAGGSVQPDTLAGRHGDRGLFRFGSSLPPCRSLAGLGSCGEGLCLAAPSRAEGSGPQERLQLQNAVSHWLWCCCCSYLYTKGRKTSKASPSQHNSTSHP